MKYAFNPEWSKLQYVAALLALDQDDEIELFGAPFDKTVDHIGSEEVARILKTQGPNGLLKERRTTMGEAMVLYKRLQAVSLSWTCVPLRVIHIAYAGLKSGDNMVGARDSVRRMLRAIRLGDMIEYRPKEAPFLDVDATPEEFSLAMQFPRSDPHWAGRRQVVGKRLYLVGCLVHPSVHERYGDGRLNAPDGVRSFVFASHDKAVEAYHGMKEDETWIRMK